jgi:hypothetical protein
MDMEFEQMKDLHHYALERYQKEGNKQGSTIMGI